MKKPLFAILKKCAMVVLFGVLICTICIGLVACSEDKNTEGEGAVQWYYGIDTPTTQGVSGDFYIDTDDYILYRKEAGRWIVVMENFGKPAQDNTSSNNQGTAWFNGTDITGKKSTIYASIATAKVGDMYINTKTADVYKCTAQDTWKFIMNLSVDQEKQEWDEDNTLKILSIGNSFSVDAHQYTYQVAKSLGVEKVVLGNMYIPACTLSKHLSNARYNTAAYTYYSTDIGAWKEEGSYTIEDAVLSEDWDYITFQQASGQSGQADTYDDLQKLIDIVEPLCPKAKLVWYMTWAYQADSTNTNFPTYDSNQTTMYNAIVNAVKTKIVTNDDIDRVIPVGTAIQNARTSSVGDTLTRDGYHLSYGLGRYIAGLCFIHSLTNIPIDNITYKPSDVTSEQQQIAIEAIKNAIAKPYEVTQSQYA